MAEVFKAQDETLGRTVAIKTMLPQYASDPTFAARFRQEAQAAANLASPYIVNIYDWGQDADTYFIAMEYVRGVDLKTAINQRGPINQRKVAEIGSQVCSALSVAHGYDIIHRDIKPQNIMIQPDGNSKVMDFGIARSGNSSLTQTSSVLGTAHYVSPEQAQGKKLDARSDLYSLGIVLYEAATGKLPFDAPDAVSVAMKQVSEQPMPPSVINPDITPGLEAIILQAMEKDPENRFASANDMKTALNNYLAGRPIMLGVAGIDGGETAVMNRVATGYQPDGTAVMPAVENPNAMNYKNYSSRDNHGKDEQRAQNKSRGPLIGAIVAIIAVIAIIAAALALSNCSGDTSPGSVPDIVGMTKSKAVSTITAAGYEVGDITEASSETVAIGNVISQDPKADASGIEEGSKINFVVSTGSAEPAKTEVPDLSGMTASQAEAALSSANLLYASGDSQYSDTIEAGKVLSQSVAAGTKVDEGTTITYVISLGNQNIEIPDVTGMTQSTATTTLKDAGFAVSVSESYSDSVASGSVISQSPAAGASMSKGGTVKIVVSKGEQAAEQVTVPDLTGKTLAEATSTLSGLGLEITSSGTTGGVVGDQTPSGGTKVDKGATVQVILE